jgi:hypothetical protein
LVQFLGLGSPRQVPALFIPVHQFETGTSLFACPFALEQKGPNSVISHEQTAPSLSL